MVKRKAAPRIQSPSVDTNEPILQRNDTANPELKRYSLSDAPTPTQTHFEHNETMYDDINEEVDRMLSEYRDEDLPSHQAPYLNEASPSSSQPRLVNYPPQPSMSPQPGIDYQRYQPGQYLAPIMTGETLQLDDPTANAAMIASPSSNIGLDPFYDPQTPLATTPQPLPQAYYYDQDYNPPSSISHSSSYETANTLRAGSELDHFQHDTEAYASGRDSRSSPYRIPRSRSPTPAADDDYYIVNHDSIYSGYGSPGGHPYDPEKDALQQQYGYPKDSRYLGSEHDIVYDPEPPTPSSTQATLPDTPLETRHFGPAPTGRVLRRHKTTKRVRLTNGNLVVNLDVPPKLVLPRKGEPETMQTRYTAVTCDPDDFEKSGFFLKQNETGRRTELFIVITMYNEDEVLFCRTMYGVMRNISHLCTRKSSQTWGPNAWEKVVVCIVADGRKKVHPRVLDCLTLLGVYQAGSHMMNRVNEKDVTAHLFEYTTSFALDPNLHFRYPDKGIVPTQIIFCMKEKNQKKINSHRWFFNAFAPLLQPNVCVLLDVGTFPSKNSIYRLWKAFDINSNVAGACGEIATYKGKNWSLLLNPLVAAQNFEYKISCILDKPTESLFGYISVLPGAFSAYRYIALQNDKNGVGPLASYFKGEVLHGRDTDIFTSNMYLAEDRILCFELVAKANSNWVLKYVKGAIGETDVPDDLPEFISQRRRWLNGSFFAATYAIAHVGQVLRSGHSFSRKVMLMVETVYNIINLTFSWFSLGNFYLFFIVLTSSLEDASFGLPGIQVFNTIVQYIMATTIIACFLFSMGNKPKAASLKYRIVTLILSLLMVYMLIASIACAIQAATQGGTANSVMLLSVLITYGLYAFSSLLAFDPWHMLTSFVQYMLLSPMYINVLNIYAFSNLDDARSHISWGTKEDTTPETDLGAVVQDKHAQVDVEMLSGPADVNSLYEDAIANLRDRVPVESNQKKSKIRSVAEKEAAAKDYYANVRTNVLLTWVFSNGLLLVFILTGGSKVSFDGHAEVNRTKVYLVFILAFTTITNSIRFLGSTFYLLARLITG